MSDSAAFITSNNRVADAFEANSVKPIACEANRGASRETVNAIDATRALVESAQAGDAESFAELYRRFGAMVHGVLLARVAYKEVDDLVQEVFILAYRNLSALRAADFFGGWLMMIARNVAAEHHRRAHPTDELTDDVINAQTTSAGLDEKLQVLEIMRAIRGLPETYGETLVLRLVEGMSGNEIAAHTGMTAASVRVNLHRGMKLLREQLKTSESLARQH